MTFDPNEPTPPNEPPPLGTHLGPFLSAAEVRMRARQLHQRAGARARARRVRRLAALAATPVGVALAAVLVSVSSTPPEPARLATGEPTARVPRPPSVHPGPSEPASSATGAPSCPPSSGPALVAREARAFVDSVGVGLRLTRARNVPFAPEEALALLDELGVRHATDRIERAADLETLRPIDRSLLLAVPSQVPLTKVVETLGARVFAVTPLSVEFRQGIDTPGWPGYARGLQGDLRTRAHQMPRPLATVGGEIWVWQGQALGNLGPLVDYGRLQYAMADFPPGNLLLEAELASARAMFGGRPLIATSAGFATGGQGRPVSEVRQAKYVPRMLFEFWNRGVVRTYVRTLRDDAGDREGHYGLVRADGTRKPAFHALRDLLGLLHDHGRPGSATAPPLHLAGAEAPDVHHTLLVRADGRTFLALWLERPSDDEDVTAAVRVRSDWPLTRALWHLPGTAEPPLPVSAVAGEMTVEVRDRVGVLEIEAACGRD